MPAVFLHLGIMLLVICIWFLMLKRPVYEAILISFLVLLTVSGNWGNVLTYINEGLSTSLIYSMTAFVAMSIILTKTKVIDSCVSLILALLGRIPGGAGYTAVVASAFMGSLSGSGPGNVMATGVITIPAMKRSGFPSELAANIESNASCLGNMIPPSSNIVAAYGAYLAFKPESELTSGKFWIVLWGLSLWFILEKLIMVWIFCKYYKIKAIPKAELPNLKDVFKQSWQGLFLPVIILLPFVCDYLFKDNFFTDRLGAAGAKSLSSSMILFIAGVAAAYACFIAKDKKVVTPHALAKTLANSVKSISPTISAVIFGYILGNVFNAGDMEAFITGVNMNKFGMVFFICLLTCILGMVIPGSSQVVVFGKVFISALAAVGVNPLLAAAMLPCICGVMGNITPPLAVSIYAGMTLAEADFGKTVKNELWWVAAQFILQIIVLMGVLPIIGL